MEIRKWARCPRQLLILSPDPRKEKRPRSHESQMTESLYDMVGGMSRRLEFEVVLLALNHLYPGIGGCGPEGRG